MKNTKTIRLRPLGVRIIVILLLLAVLTVTVVYGKSKPKEHNEARVIMQEAMFIKRVNAANLAVEKKAYEERVEREVAKWHEELEKRKEEERLREEERKREEERLARVESMLWSGDAGSYQLYCWTLFPNYGWDEYDLECLIELWRRESQWNPHAHNSSSGAHGIPQSLPASKMASHGADYWDNPYTQIRWGLDYISGRYGAPRYALGHSNSHGWY